MEALYIVGGLMFGTALLGVARLFALPRWWREFQDFRQWRIAYYGGTLPDLPAPLPVTQAVPQAPTLPPDATPLQGAAYALAKPPQSLRATLDWLRRPDKDRPYAFPLGWVKGATNDVALNSASFVGDVNHILITGQSDVGKDNLALNILLTLCLRHTPQELQICVIDGKGLDFAGWEGKAHTWGLALEPKQIAPMMGRLSKERERRRGVLATAQASKWDNYQGDGLPLLCVYISELSLLEDATSLQALAQWLNSELAAGRAFGLRFIVASQTAANFPTRWRSQIGLFLAGFQPSPSQDAPNTGLSTSELATVSSVPPSKLPAPPRGAGVFTAVQGAECETVRATYLTDDQRRAWLARLPDAPKPVEVVTPFVNDTPLLAALLDTHPATTTPATTVTTNVEAPVERPETPPSEPEPVEVVATANDEKILQLWHDGLSNAAIERAIFGFTGGAAYRDVKRVIDAAKQRGVVRQCDATTNTEGKTDHAVVLSV